LVALMLRVEQVGIGSHKVPIGIISYRKLKRGIVGILAYSPYGSAVISQAVPEEDATVESAVWGVRWTGVRGDQINSTICTIKTPVGPGKGKPPY
jgi:hypothetical protein